MIQTIFIVSAAVLGACVGSFLNVVIHRVPTRTFLSGGSRSRCPKCGAPIAWFDNVPVLSWAVLLRGKGRCCGNPISARYPLVEVLTAATVGALFWWTFVAGGGFATVVQSGSAWLEFAFKTWFLAFLIACTFIDIDHRILPDVLTKPTMLVGWIAATAIPGMAGSFAASADWFDSLLASLVGSATGFLVTAGIRSGASKVFGREAMGFGDVKFMAAIGAFVGWDGALITFFAGSVLGAVYGSLHQWITKERQIYFGPFLAVGAGITLFFKPLIVEFVTVTWPQWQRSAALSPWALVGVAVVCVALLFFNIRRARK